VRTVLVTQRVVVDPTSGERRDALDQNWHRFLERCDLRAVPVPNQLGAAEHVIRTVPHAGIVLSGGNDLACVGGDAPERDAVETRLLDHASAARLPVLGVCRGMQLLVARFGGALEEVAGHARTEHRIEIDGSSRLVASYHRFGCRAAPAVLEVLARADDGVVEAVRHRELALCGIMWHPERATPAHPDDVALFRRWFGAPTAPEGRA
jgi:gamma-glutamyl-gamma-aminobutyrate hydrolase PuuD